MPPHSISIGLWPRRNAFTCSAHWLRSCHHSIRIQPEGTMMAQNFRLKQHIYHLQNKILKDRCSKHWNCHYQTKCRITRNNMGLLLMSSHVIFLRSALPPPESSIRFFHRIPPPNFSRIVYASACHLQQCYVSLSPQPALDSIKSHHLWTCWWIFELTHAVSRIFLPHSPSPIDLTGHVEARRVSQSSLQQ